MPEHFNNADLVVEYVDRVEEIVNKTKTIDKKKATEHIRKSKHTLVHEYIECIYDLALSIPNFEGEQSDITSKPRKVYKKPCSEYKCKEESSQYKKLPLNTTKNANKVKIASIDSEKQQKEENDRIEWNTDMYITSQKIKNKVYIPKTYSNHLPNKQKFGGKQIKYYPSDYFKEKYLYPYPTYTSYLENEPTSKPTDIPKELHRRELNCGSTFEPYLENQTEYPCSMRNSGCLKEDKYYIPQILKDIKK